MYFLILNFERGPFRGETPNFCNYLRRHRPAWLNWFRPRMDHKGFSTSPQCAACALGSTLLGEKISNQEMICIHIFLMCLLFVDLSVGAKMSNTGLLQRAKRFSQFKTVKVGEVWNDLKSSKVVSYTLTRDLTVVGENFETTVTFSQFLFVQMMWLTLHLLFWKGSITENR